MLRSSITIVSLITLFLTSCNTNTKEADNEPIIEVENIEAKTDSLSEEDQNRGGNWTYNIGNTGITITYTIKEKAGKYYFNVSSNQDPSGTVPKDEPIKKDGNKYSKNNEFGEYFIINPDKTLSIYDNEGLVRNVKPD